MKARSRSSVAVALATLAAVFAGGVVASDAAAAERDPWPDLFRHYAPLASIDRRAMPYHGPTVQRWRLVTTKGDTILALWRPAPAGVQRPWTAVMLGGFYTGDKAALLLPPDAPFNSLAVNWPWRGPRRMNSAEFAMRLPEIQRAIMRSPAVLAVGVEAVSRTRGVDPSRIVLVGASLGAPPALAALRFTGVPDALVLVDGGADLEMLIGSALEREGWAKGPASLSAAGAFQWIWPLEPMLNAKAAAKIPVLCLNGANDERVPRASAVKLHESLPHATVRWRSGTHINPIQREVIGRMARDVETWLRAHDRSGPAATAKSAWSND